MPDPTGAAPGQEQTLESDVAGRIADYRHVRELVERDILPLATSVDGRNFDLQASLYGLELRRGGYVVLEAEDGTRLGQITDLRADSGYAGAGTGERASIMIRMARGAGTVLDRDSGPFHDATVRPARPDEVGAWLGRVRPRRAGLAVGELLLAPGVPAVLDSGGLNRHTFMCGQSGSGKTYSLGVLIERVLAETSLRLVILDPNSDYVALGRVRDGADPTLVSSYEGVPQQVSVWSNDPASDHPLRLRFADLDPAAQAAVLGLDPFRDRDEYSVLLDLLQARKDGKPVVSGVEQLLDADAPGARQLGLRARNLGIFDWRLWSPELPSLVEELRQPTARCTVVDLGSLDTTQEQRVVAEATLAALWGSRRTKQPCLLVIDEAHNICPAEPEDDLSRLSSQTAVQIAAEGRKFGLYLLTSTQRPHKVHENVVSQCDNLLLMRMNSDADLTDLGRLLSFVPSGLMAGATSFGMGQALVAGRLVPQATYVQMGERVSEEGGADVPTTWAAPR